jgi:nucleoredoxin
MKTLLALLLLAPTVCLASLQDLIGTELVNAKGETVDVSTLEGKVIGLYFSASWCGPCRAFTPELVKLRDRNDEDFEVVFVSSDRSADDQQEYMKDYDMEWPAIPFDSSKRGELSGKFGISGIPSLVIVDSDGNLITKNGRGEALENGRKAVRTWLKAAGKDPGTPES